MRGFGRGDRHVEAGTKGDTGRNSETSTQAIKQWEAGPGRQAGRVRLDKAGKLFEAGRKNDTVKHAGRGRHTR
jgi:hypothetical protein